MRTALAFFVALLVVGCGPRPRPAVSAAEVAPTLEPEWHTLRAVHKVTVEVTLPNGKTDKRSLRGVIAIERPDRFRLRALGPGGITLFDLLSVGGKVEVLKAIRDPRSSQLGPIITALAGDLQAAFRLTPAPPGRKVAIEDGAVVVREPERTVRLTGWRKVSGRAVATRIEIENPGRHYTVHVEVSNIEVDPALDPALFSR
ncbi:MAG TPA: hypothetical protein VII38_21220 [Polyangia bacterium]